MHREIMSGSDATSLHAAARRQGMFTLYEDGLRKVAKGLTSMEEVLRVTQDQSEANEDDMLFAEDASVAETVPA